MTTMPMFNASRRSITVGLSVVLTTVLVGVAVSYASGLTSPMSVFADEATSTPAAPVAETTTTTAEPNPSCTLSADRLDVTVGEQLTFSWTTEHADGFTINSLDQHLGQVPDDQVAEGSMTVTIEGTATYFGTAQRDGIGSSCFVSGLKIHEATEPNPSCTLTASKHNVVVGEEVTFSWTTEHADGFAMNHDLGQVPTDQVASGSKVVTITDRDTYFGTAQRDGIGSSCFDKDLKVSWPETTKPDLTAGAVSPLTAVAGTAKTFSATISNIGAAATGAPFYTLVQRTNSIDSNGNATSPVTEIDVLGTTPLNAGGTIVKSVDYTFPTADNGTTRYLRFCADKTTSGPANGDVTESNENNNCGPWTPITVGDGTHTPAPTCTLKAIPPSTLTLSAIDYNNDTKIDQDDAQFLLEVAVGTKACPAGKVCDLNGDNVVRGGTDPFASDALMLLQYVNKTDRVGDFTLEWTSANATDISIDQGVGSSIIPIAIGTNAATKPTVTTTYTATATGPGGQGTCSVTVTVDTPPGGGGGGGGGGGHGGGGSSPRPSVIVSSTARAGQVAGEYIYLAQAPYTGLDLGPIGTMVYWFVLLAWSGLLAYIVLFNGFPALRRYVTDLGVQVEAALNHETVAPRPVVHTAAPVRAAVAEAPRSYSSFDGFKSFGSGENLSIEDIVKGLARSHKIESVPAMAAQTEPIYEHVEPIAPVTESVTSHEAAVTGVSVDVRGFANALLAADREGVFAGLRQHVRGGGAPEKLLSQVTFLLDDAYRARVEGTECDADIARQAARLTTPQLEKLVISLTTAIDSSYSVDVTGAKLALTRALAVLGA